MNRTELFDLIRNGENSTLEFKRDDIQNHDLAKELVAFLNQECGGDLNQLMDRLKAAEIQDRDRVVSTISVRKTSFS